MNIINKKVEEIVNGLPCCKVCQCENGKKIWCACHRKQIKSAMEEVMRESKREILDKYDKIFNPSKEECLKCGKPMIQDLESKVFGTDRWDEHTYKYDCECFDKNVRLSIG